MDESQEQPALLENTGMIRDILPNMQLIFGKEHPMRKVILFIAASLDGYIADRSGGVDWLQGQSADDKETDSYSEFVKGIDTVVMGWNTYHQIVTELPPDEWVYGGLTSYVITNRACRSTDEVRFTCSSLLSFRVRSVRVAQVP